MRGGRLDRASQPGLASICPSGGPGSPSSRIHGREQVPAPYGDFTWVSGSHWSPFKCLMSQQECMLHLVLAFSAELSCRSGPEGGDPVGGAAATPEPTSSSIYPCFRSLDLLCFCQGWEAWVSLPLPGVLPCVHHGAGKSSMCGVGCGPLTSTFCPFLHILHILYGR